MKTRIYCKNPRKGVHSFYITVAGEEYFLFNQKFHFGVEKFFRNGVWLEEVFNLEKAHRDTAILRTCLKLPNYIRYAESEFGIAVLDQTLRKQKRFCRTEKLSA